AKAKELKKVSQKVQELSNKVNELKTRTDNLEKITKKTKKEPFLKVFAIMFMNNFPPVATALIADKKGLEKGESHVEALKREVKEETGLEVKKIGDLVFRFIDKESRFDIYFYEVKAVGKPKAKEPDK
ncbi:13141_t:CDS:2, partial [Racocetra persica]